MRWAPDGEYPPAKRQALWGAGVVLVPLAVIGLCLLAIRLTSPPSSPQGYDFGNGIAAQSNLQNALTGAKTYQASAGTFTGLMTGAIGISSISQIGTGLTWTAAASTGPHVISEHVAGNGDALVLTAFSDGTKDCWGILDLTTHQPSPVLGESEPGTYFFVGRADTNCVAATVLPSSVATGGFPSA